MSGTFKPVICRMSWKFFDHPWATVMDATAYSRIRSQPMIQAIISPSVAYAYVYADPATGAIDANSA